MLEVFAVGAVWFYFIMRRKRQARRINGLPGSQKSGSEGKKGREHSESQVFYDANQTTKHTPMETEPVAYKQNHQRVRRIPEIPKQVEKSKPIQCNMPRFNKRFNRRGKSNGFEGIFGSKYAIMDFYEASESSEIVEQVMVKIEENNPNEINNNTEEINNAVQEGIIIQEGNNVVMPVPVIPVDNVVIVSEAPFVTPFELFTQPAQPFQPVQPIQPAQPVQLVQLAQPQKLVIEDIKQKQAIQVIVQNQMIEQKKNIEQKQQVQQMVIQKQNLEEIRQKEKENEKNPQQQQSQQGSKDSFQLNNQQFSQKALMILRHGKKIKKLKPSNNPLQYLSIKSIGKLDPQDYRYFYNSHSKTLINHLPTSILQKKRLRSSNLASRILQSRASSRKQANLFNHNYILNGENYDPFNETQKIQCLSLW